MMGDGGVTSSATMMQVPPPTDGTTSMDFDYMGELFLDGCWLEAAADGSDFLLQSPSFSNLYDPSFPWPALETNDYNESQEAAFGNQQGSQNMVNVVADGCRQQFQSETHSVEGASEVVRRWWFPPTPNPGPGPSIMEKLIRALKLIKYYNRNKDMLIQIWVPVHRGGKPILAANDLLFSLESRSPNLAKYREISARYQFSAEEEDSKELVPGLPGRVFRDKVPEWTPDVRFFRSDEYPRVDHAQEYDVRGTLAVPIFEQGSRMCLGVVEVVMTTQQINYGPELESVCKALEAVDLRSSKHSSIQNVKPCNRSYEAALPEIQEVLRSACEMHKLPLAQTWVSCIQQGKEGCRHTEDNYLLCISPVEHACYVGDHSTRFFHEACTEHHLLKGQGVAGRAFMTNQPCFSADITSLSKIDYPLSHHARLFGLRAAVAIRLRSIYNSTDDFVLEFFLPVDCNDSEEQRKMLTSLSIIIQRVCGSLRVITDEELEETNLSVDEVIALADSGFARTPIWSHLQPKGMVASLETEEKSSETMGRKFSDLRQQQENPILKGNLDCVRECSTSVEGSLPSVGISKTVERRRAKAEKTITLQVLRQYFAGSLKDAAKNIGVCTTTLKRICRQHGIKRWPSRKIKKVGHSLQKLQLVIDSVQGASGAFQIDSFYSNFPDLASSNLSGTNLFSTLNQTENPNSMSTQQHPGSLSPEGTSKSPSSSCSQSSISSHSCSSMSELQPHTINVVGNKDPMVGEDSADVVLKRIRSEAELKSLSQERAKLLPRSHSQETLGEQSKTQYQRPLLETSRKVDAQRVKVTYRDEKSRFRMPKNWGYEHLLQEIARRFNVSDMSKFDVKYLDDDCEWVLLTCDADLEECIDVCQSSESGTIKLCLQPSSHSMRNSLEFR
ncbi:protein NLP4-like isoform X2 [Abrus precatorius]|uniref:Protein NLP4-like isoform X2 n=1 Tax=Abrus precatorius TaxID=3816 RepID=A0A8B8LIX0_ABRPR|nr:protein NLP4-like isoform X2 [Abrus precatorius]XP_027354744.1 protein NLP4-like isoform X2 [Abrus precatorius]XP_027354745.1 protein NLP4-like isoform X2 [Abrus precatorius]